MNALVRRHPVQRKYLEFTQDLIVSGLCLLLFVIMGVKLVDLARAVFGGTDFSLVIGEILFILVLLELFRLMLIYLDEHRVSVATMVEVGIVSTLREVILRGALHVDWPQLLVVCAFMLTLGAVLRFSGIRLHPKGGVIGTDPTPQSPEGNLPTTRLPMSGNEGE